MEKKFIEMGGKEMKMKSIVTLVTVLLIAAPVLAWEQQVESFDDFVTDGWVNLMTATYTQEYVVQAPPGLLHEGTGSLRWNADLMDTSPPPGAWEWGATVVQHYTDFDLDNAGLGQALRLWVWRDEPGDTQLHNIRLWNDQGDPNIMQSALFSFESYPTNTGWTEYVAIRNQFVVDIGTAIDWTSIDRIDLYCSTWDGQGATPLYIDDLRISDDTTIVYPPFFGTVMDADYATITVDANPADWAALNSDPNIMSLPALCAGLAGDLILKWQLAWDKDYLYILYEEQVGDTLASEADCVNGCVMLMNDGVGGDVYYDAMTLFMDFEGNGIVISAGIDLWLNIGLSSDAPLENLLMIWMNGGWSPDIPGARTNALAAYAGALGSRIVEVAMKWQDIHDNLAPSWRHPGGSLINAIKPGYVFGCDPRIDDLELQWVDGPGEGGSWKNSSLWGNPTGFDAFSTDVQLIYSGTCAQLITDGFGMPGDTDNDCDVDFYDMADVAADWMNCNDPADPSCWL